MGRRVIGGLVGWLIGVLPLIGANIADYNGIYLGDPVLVGMLTLFGGLLVGAVVSGFVGGRTRSGTMSGATGASISGGISAALYAITIIAFIFIAHSSDALPAIASEHPIRISVAILFFAAVFLGIAMLVGLLVGRGKDEMISEQPAMRMSRTNSLPRQGVSTSIMHQGQWSGPQSGQQPYRQDVSARYNTSQASPAPVAPPMRRGDERSQPVRRARHVGDSYDDARYAEERQRSAYPAGQRRTDRDPRDINGGGW